MKNFIIESFQKPKIAFLHYSYPPIVGGVENLVHTHAQLFSSHGYRVHVYASLGENSNPNITLKLLPELTSLKKINNPLSVRISNETQFPKEFYEISEKIYKFLVAEANNFDILIAHNIFSLNLNAAIAYALINFHNNFPNKKIVSWTHDIVLDNREESPVKRHFPNPELEKNIYQPIPGIHYVAISNFLKKTLISLRGFTPESITVIHNGIHIPDFLNFHPLTRKLIKQYSISLTDILLLFPAKIMPHKNIELCLQAVAELVKKGKKVKIVLTAKEFPHNKGDSYISSIQKRIEDLAIKDSVVLIADHFKDCKVDEVTEIIKNFYELSDVVLYPSKYENFGLPLIEAGLTKTPIICSNLEVFTEVGSTNIYSVDNKSSTGGKVADMILKIVQETKSGAMFQLVKKTYEIENIFKNSIEPFIQRILV